MDVEQSQTNPRQPTLFLGLGLFWLLAAAGLLALQLLTPHIQIEWTTATEQNTAGFQLYRSTSPDGEFVLITNEIIPSVGNSLSGGSYSYLDNDVTAGDTYYYLLEEIEYDNTVNQYRDDIISGHAALMAWWAIILIALLALVGIGFIVTGLREGG